MFSGAEDVGEKLLVEVVRHGAVDGIHLAAVQQIVIVRRLETDVEIRGEPIEHFLVGITNSGDARRKVQVEQMTPTGGGAGKLPTHQAQADDAKANLLFRHAQASR